MHVKTRSKLASFIYVLFVVVFIGGRIADIQPWLCNFLTALLGLFAFGYCFFKKGFKRINTYIVLGAIFTIGMIFSMLYNENADILDVLWIWSYMGIAALIYEFDISAKTFWIVAYSVLLFILAFMFQGNAADELLKIGSENNISAYIIFFILLGYLAEENNKAMRYVPAFLTLAISLWTGSRAGVLSSIVLVCCIFLNNILVLKKGKFSTLVKMCLLVFAGIWAINHFFGDYIVSFIEKMDRYGNTSVRTEIWSEYTNGMFGNIGNFLFGVDMSGFNYPLLNFYNGNPHNSFLMFHAKYGIILVLTGLIFVLKAMWKALNRKKISIIIVILAASVRMFFDWIAFPGLYDVIFWLLVIYAIDNMNISSKNEAGNEAK